VEVVRIQSPVSIGFSIIAKLSEQEAEHITLATKILTIPGRRHIVHRGVGSTS